MTVRDATPLFNDHAVQKRNREELRRTHNRHEEIQEEQRQGIQQEALIKQRIDVIQKE